MSTPINETFDRRALCDLVAGRVADWRGLVPFAPDAVPACFGARVETGRKSWNAVEWGFQRFRGNGSESWFLDEGATVSFADLLLAPPSMSAAQMEAALGPAPWKRAVDFGEWLEAEPAGDAIDVQCRSEAVYAARGIAFLLCLTRDGTTRVRRIRAFPPVDQATYFRRFVKHGDVIWIDP